MPAWAAVRKGDHCTEAVLRDTGALPPPSQPVAAVGEAGPEGGTQPAYSAMAGPEECALHLHVPSATAVGGTGAENNTQPLPPPRPPYLMRFCAAWVYAGMCTVGVSLLEKQKR